MSSDQPTVTLERSRKQASPADADLAGAVVGRYELVERIGAGGMGTVYRARDPDLERDIAIKLVEVDVGQRERALREAQSAAAIAHPNVVAVHDVGWYQHHLYIAMELVRGETLDRWLDARPRTLDEVLELFRGVGAGLIAAHNASIFHLDIKPTNIIVSDGRPRIADFGIARRATDEGSEGAVGTPGFMAPEQRHGVGAAPADQVGFAQTLRVALGDRTISRKLEETLLRAEAEDAGDRFESMSELVSALEPERRNWLPFAALAFSAVAIAAVSLASRDSQRCEAAAAQMATVWNQSHRNAIGAALRSTPGRYVERTIETSIEALDQHAAAWSAMVESSCRDTHERDTQSARMLDLRSECLADRLREFGSVVQILSRDGTSAASAHQLVSGLTSLSVCADVASLSGRGRVPDEIAVDVARVRRELTAARNALGAADAATAARIASASVTTARELAAPRLLGESLLVLGTVQSQQRVAVAEATLREAATMAARAQDHLTELAAWTHLLRVLIDNRSKLREAKAVLPALEAAIARAGDPAEDVGVMLVWRARLQQRLGDRTAALATHQESIDVLTSAAAPKALIARARAQYSDTLALSGQFEAAKTQFLRAESVLRAHHGDDHPRLASLYQNAGLLYADAGDYGRSEELLRAAEAAIGSSAGKRSRAYSTATSNLARTLALAGKFDASRERYETALSILAESDDDPLGLAITLHDMAALVLTGAEDQARALKHYQQALAIRRRELGEDHVDVARTIFNFGLWYVRAGNEPQALESFLRAQSIFEKVTGPRSSEVASCMSAAAESLTELGRLPEAIAMFERALVIRIERSVSPLSVGETEYFLARALRVAKRDPKRIDALAKSARARFTDIGRKDLVKRVDAWYGAL